jgi:hypothetical protein
MVSDDVREAVRDDEERGLMPCGKPSSETWMLETRRFVSEIFFFEKKKKTENSQKIAGKCIVGLPCQNIRSEHNFGTPCQSRFPC